GGNVPEQPYYPKTPVNYTCQLTVITTAGNKMYRIDPKVMFSSKDFQKSGSGLASYTLSGQQDPGMNDQGISLRYSPDGKGGEYLHLQISLSLAGFSSMSFHESPGTAGRIAGAAFLSADQGQSVKMHVRCESEQVL
ncbi:MAG: hypothetical protein ACXWRE_05705, partial [Pseudobdellovibrionaceae bacterium]